MIEQISAQFNYIFSSTVFIRLAYIVSLLVGGLILAESSKRIFLQILAYIGIKRPSKDSRIRTAMRFVYISILMFSVIAASAVLGISFGQDLSGRIIDFIPNLLISALFGLGGIIFINALADISNQFTREIRLENYLDDVGTSRMVLGGVVLIFKYFLYLVLAQIVLSQLGIPSAILENTLSSIGFGVVLLVVLFLFFSLKDVIANAISGYVIRTASILSEGQSIKIDDSNGLIEQVGGFYTKISSGRGYQMFIPNSEIMKKSFTKRKDKVDLKKIEDMLTHYVVQKPSHCGPATTSMILSVFGFDYTQQQIAKIAKTLVPGGNEPQELIHAARKLTKDKVLGMLVQHKKIANLKSEIKSWLSGGGLVMLNFYKSKIMPWTKRGGHYALCVGVEDNKLIVMDPNAKEGGVYLVDHKDMLKAMKKYDKERGYTIFTLRGTPAYQRIKDGLIYSDPTLYDTISRKLAAKLLILSYRSKGKASILSEFVKNLSTGKKKNIESVVRLWKK